MGFAAPLALLGLFLLALPVAIHLRPRRTRQSVRVGSVRHLAGAPPPKRSGRRITEPALLAVRLAVLALLALVAAGPYLARGAAAPTRKVALVATPADESGPARRILDSLAAAGFELRALEPRADVWQAMRSLDVTLPPGSAIALVAPERVRAGGVRPVLASEPSVHLVPSSPAAVAPAALPVPVRRRVRIEASPARSADARLVTAALRAIAAGRDDTLEITGSAGDWLVWLPDSAGQPPPDTVRGSAHLLTDGGPAGGPEIAVRRLGAALAFTFSGRLSADSAELALTGALPELIARVWPDPPAVGGDPALRRISASQLLPERATSRRAHEARLPIGAPLLAAAALLFLGERWMAHRPIRSGTSPAAR